MGPKRKLKQSKRQLRGSQKQLGSCQRQLRGPYKQLERPQKQLGLPAWEGQSFGQLIDCWGHHSHISQVYFYRLVWPSYASWSLGILFNRRRNMGPLSSPSELSKPFFRREPLLVVISFLFIRLSADFHSSLFLLLFSSPRSSPRRVVGAEIDI